MSMSKSTRNGFFGLIGLGIVMCILGTLMGGKWGVYFDRGRPHPLDITPRTLEISEQLAFDKLDIDISMASVRVVSGDAFRVDARFDNGQVPKYELKDGTLRVFDDGAARVTMGIDVRPYKPGNTVSITLPRGKTLQMLSAKLDMGDLTLQDISTGGLNARAGMGDVSVSGMLGGRSEITCSMGTADVSGNVSGILKVTSNMGDVTVSGQLAAACELESGMGTINVSGNVTGSLKAVCSAGDVTVNAELAANCEFESKMGTVEVTTSLPRDRYTLSTHTGMGSTTVDPRIANQPGAAYTLFASSDMGDVDVKFGG